MQIALPPNRLRELADRDHKRLSVIAAHCDVDQSTVHRWRAGKSAIPDEQKFRLAALFDVSVSYLMGWDADDPNSTLPPTNSIGKQAA